MCIRDSSDGEDQCYAFGHKSISVPGIDKPFESDQAYLGVVLEDGKIWKDDEVQDVVDYRKICGIDIPCNTRPKLLFMPATECVDPNSEKNLKLIEGIERAAKTAAAE